ncbi:MAG: GNAT family N-acetyltransferase [Bacteroidetes bacterium]|nr:GNAT family N-acetyltransferase [Bacteroidota bacterium]
MEFHRLHHTTIPELTDAFNKAFENYEVSMQLTPEMMQDKLKAERIDLEKSIGAYDDGLVGFILFGYDDVNGKKVMWDGGTGVIASHRGQKLTERMFEQALPIAAQNDVQQMLLEVLVNNTVAEKIYEKLGFKIVRKLHCYKGIPTDTTLHHHVEDITGCDIDALTEHHDWTPTWQHMNSGVRNSGNAIKSIGIKTNGSIVAYTHYNTVKNRILQLAVDRGHRRKKMGATLINHIYANSTRPIMAINIDANDEVMNSFLKSIGLQHFISQYEMSMDI